MEVDDLPVGGAPGGSGGNPFGSEFPDEAPPSSQPSNKSLEERLVSKKWNERASAYEELSEQIKRVKSAKDSLLHEHSEGFK